MADVITIGDAVLTIVDTAGIQNYIFGSNRLRENSGASYLVEQATRGWVYRSLDRLGKHNITLKTGAIDWHLRIEEHDLTAELIYAGGGNTTILFRSLDAAKSFAWDLSSHVLREAPGLRIVIAHSELFEWNPRANDLVRQCEALRDGALSWKKRTLQGNALPLLGLGVTAECASTGLVATDRVADPEGRIVSREIKVKSAALEAAKERLRDKFFHEVDPNGKYYISDELDQLGRTGGDESYIAVVHVDGNDMGRLFDECGANASDNRNYIERLRGLSEGVDKASTGALIATLRRLMDQISEKKLGDETEWYVKEVDPCVKKPDLRAVPKEIKLFRDETTKNKPCWPLRPMVFGGDDVTFVCNGQLGLSLAAIYMKAFAEKTKSLSCGPIHTGAGICIVKVHYPFRRAYDLSVALTAEAKALLGDQKRNASALDWHISSTGLSGGLGSIRRQEYSCGEGSLLMRPVWLSHPDEWRTWDNFNRLVAHFNYQKPWAGRRNKLKELREVLRVGKDAVQEFLSLNRFAGSATTTTPGDDDSDDYSGLPGVLKDQGRHLDQSGWESERCVYFDSLEAMDHHFLLEEVRHGNADENPDFKI
jgi:hypothetical protein